MQNNGSRTLTIVQRMQTLGIVGGKPQLVPLAEALCHAVQLGCGVFGPEWGDFTVVPEYRLPKDLGEVAIMPSDFDEAVANLVTNACQAVRIWWEADGNGLYVPSLMVGAEVGWGDVAVTFWDNGTGIADDVLPRIFNPFFTTRYGALGAGLRLPFAGDVARRSGGDLTVEMDPRSWTRFAMTVPVDLPLGSDEVLGEPLGPEATVAARSFGVAAPP